MHSTTQCRNAVPFISSVSHFVAVHCSSGSQFNAIPFNSRSHFTAVHCSAGSHSSAVHYSSGSRVSAVEIACRDLVLQRTILLCPGVVRGPTLVPVFFVVWQGIALMRFVRRP